MKKQPEKLRKKYDKVLAKIADVPPVPGDEFVMSADRVPFMWIDGEIDRLRKELTKAKDKVMDLEQRIASGRLALQGLNQKTSAAPPEEKDEKP